MRLISTKVAAVMLGCSTTHLHNLVARGVLTNHGKLKPWLLDIDEIERAIDNGLVTPNPTGKED